MRFFNNSSPIRLKITLPYLFLAILVIFGGAYIVTSIIIDSIEERFENNLVEVGKIANDLLVRQENEQLETLRLVSRVEGIGAVIQSGDVQRLRSALLPFFVNSQQEFVAVVLPDGTSLLTMQKTPDGDAQIVYAQGGSLFADEAIVTQVLNSQVDEQGDKYAAVLTIDGIEHFVVSGPIVDGREVVAVALVGEPLAEIAADIRRSTLAQVAFYGADQDMILSTFVSPPQIGRDEKTPLESQSVIRSVLVSDITYREMFGAWTFRNGEPGGWVGVALPNNFISETSSITRLNFSVLLFVTLILIIGIGLYIARVITRPILSLRDAALEVTLGNLDVSIPPVGEDEIAVLTDTFNKMVTNLKVSKQQLVNAYDKTLEGWSKALELRDQVTEGHTQRVTEMTVGFARSLGVAEPQLEYIRRGALLHDIGKVGVPDSILNKAGALTPLEIQTIRKHPEYSREIIQKIDFLTPSLDIPYSHHEKWDGSGYPQGLRGEAIPFAARIFSLVDVWDAITTDRPYRKAMSFDESVNVIREDSGAYFDPGLVEAFIAYVRRLERSRSIAEPTKN
jgi:putative nucleotidyltransferase with HDIG domain